MRVFLITALVLIISKTSHACSVCFVNSPDSKQADALQNAVLLMLYVLVGMMVLFGTFFINFARRSHALENRAEKQ